MYKLEKYSGEEYLNGAEKDYFAQIRAAMLVGLDNLKEPINLKLLKRVFDDLYARDEKFQNMVVDISYEELKRCRPESISRETLYQMVREHDNIRIMAAEVCYLKLSEALQKGISKDDELRFPILDFVSGTTKNYVVLYAVLEKVDFTREKEFAAIYGNFAKQSTDSREKRNKLATIRTEAVKILIAQTDTALNKLHDGKLDIEEIERREKELLINLQDNLLIVSTYTISDEILDMLLRLMSFKKKGSFNLFYKNLVRISNCANKDKEEIKQEREAQRKKVIEWIKLSHNWPFLKEAFSAVFTYESSEAILDEVLAILDSIEQKEGSRIELSIPFSSFNRDKYEEHYKKTEEQKDEISLLKITGQDIKHCEALVRDIAYLGIDAIVKDARNEGKLAELASTANKAFALKKLDETIMAEIKKAMGRYDWKIAKNIMEHHGICAADINDAENESPEQKDAFGRISEDIKKSQGLSQ